MRLWNRSRAVNLELLRQQLSASWRAFTTTGATEHQPLSAKTQRSPQSLVFFYYLPLDSQENQAELVDESAEEQVCAEKDNIAIVLFLVSIDHEIKQLLISS